MAYALPADLIVFVHLAFIVFVVGGELLVIVGAPLRWAWIRNRIFRCAHLLAIVFVAVNAVLGILCPLTIWEAQLRQRAGQASEEDISFVGRLLRDVIYYELPECRADLGVLQHRVEGPATGNQLIRTARV